MSLSLPPSDATRGEVELTLTGASFGYRPEKVLLHDLTLSARAGDFISICGENGAGKSTLLKGFLIARAVLASRRFIVLDEPCAGLDTQNTERIMDALYDLNQTQGTTILQVTHDKVAALRYSSHVWHVADGAVHDESLEEHLGEARG